MNTYRVYMLDTSNVEAPVVVQGFFQATKYSDAWAGARAVLSGKAEDRAIFAEANCTEKLELAGDLTVAKILDCTPRNKKLDKATLADILADESLSAEERLAKISQLSK